MKISGVLLSVLLAAQVATPPSPLTSEQALALRQITDLRWSPDGKFLAFVVAQPPKGTDRDRDIWLLSPDLRTVRQLTFAPKNDTSPRWSPDGRTLAFLSDRDGPQQIYLLPMAGGEARTLTDGKNGVQAFEWSPDGRQIAYLAPEPRTEAEERKQQDKDDARTLDRDDRHPRLWVIDLAAPKPVQLTKGSWRVGEFKWMPGGQSLLVSATDTPASDRETDRVFLVSLSDPVPRQVAAPRGPFGQLRPSPDGRAFAYVAARVDGPTPHDLCVQTLGEPSARNLSRAAIDRPVSSYSWRPDGSMVVLIQTGFKSRLYAMAADGRAEALPVLPVNPVSFALAQDGGIAFVGDTTRSPQEIFFWKGAGDAEPLSHFNDSWKALPLATPEFFRYKSFDGLEIEASLVRPIGYQDGTKVPLVVIVHGGPTGRWDDRFEAWGQLLASRGYAVLYPNIRGSVGYGHAFIEMNRANWGGGDFKDVMAGVDAVIARGIADPARLGIGGWSYGGYMAAWAITQTTRFKAAVAGAGLSDLASEFGTEDHSAYDEWFFGLPYEKLDGFIRCSPITYIRNARTPTLILQGENDVTDPIGQSQQLYRGLKRYGVETDFVLYPREGHGLREEKHLLDRLNRIVAWFDKYLGPRGGTP